MVESERAQLTIWQHVACWTGKATYAQARFRARKPTPTHTHTHTHTHRHTHVCVLISVILSCCRSDVGIPGIPALTHQPFTALQSSTWTKFRVVPIWFFSPLLTSPSLPPSPSPFPADRKADLARTHEVWRKTKGLRVTLGIGLHQRCGYLSRRNR